jgi:hypothetical protein
MAFGSPPRPLRPLGLTGKGHRFSGHIGALSEDSVPRRSQYARLVLQGRLNRMFFRAFYALGRARRMHHDELPARVASAALLGPGTGLSCNCRYKGYRRQDPGLCEESQTTSSAATRWPPGPQVPELTRKRISAALVTRRPVRPIPAFSLQPGTEAKIFATALGGGILIDATIIRGVLTPAAVALLGRWNWWLPNWAARILRVEPSPAPPKPDSPPAPQPG